MVFINSVYASGLNNFLHCRNCIIDKNARIGRNVILTNSQVGILPFIVFDGKIFIEESLSTVNALPIVPCSFLQNVEDSDRSDEGFYIRSGITVIPKNSTIKDGTIV